MPGHVVNITYADYLTFTIARPKGRNTNIMTVGAGNAEHYVDCGNAKDVERLAIGWIRDFYGQTVKDIRVVE